MDWDHLKIVLAISRTGSLTAAAHTLNIDQTTAGRRLNAIEEQLATPLFRRAKSGFVISEAGQVVVENARAIEAQLARMHDDLDVSRSEAIGLLRLMGNTWMLTRIAEVVLPRFLASNSGLEVRLSNRLPPTTAHSEPAVSLWFDAAAIAPDKSFPFCSVPYATYCSDLECDERNVWVQFQDDLAQGPSFSRRLRMRYGPDAQVPMTATDASVLQAAVRAGAGLCVLPMCLAEEDPLLIRSKRYPDEIQRVLHLHVSPEAYELRRVAMFIAALESQVETMLNARRLKLKI